jgi:hypothetical protein
MAETVDFEINAKVKNGKDVKELGDDTKEAAGAAKSLKTQIRETQQAIQKLEQSGKASGKELNDLRNKLDDLNDAADRAKFKSGQFGDKLASLPGPLGKVGGGLKSVGDSFATFGKTLTISLGVVGLLVTAFIAIKDALGKTKEGQEGLSKATTALNKVIAPFFALLEKVGLLVLPIITKGFEALGTVMNKVAKFFGASDSKINEVTASLEKNNEAANTLAEAEKARLDALDKKKQAAAAAEQKREEQRKAALQARLDGLQAQDKLDEARLAKEKAIALAGATTEQTKLNIEKQFAKRSFDQKQKDLKDLQANYAVGTKEFKEYQAQLIALEASYATERAGFKDRQKEINKEKRKEEFEAEKQALELQFSQGILTEEQYQSQLLDVRKKYATNNQELVQVEIDRATQNKEKLKKIAEEDRQLAFATLQGQIDDLDRLNQARDDDFAQDIERLEAKKVFLQQQRDLELKAAEKDKVKQLEITKKYGDAEVAVDKEITATKKSEFEARKALQLQYTDVVGQLGAVLQQAAGQNKSLAIAGLVIEQAAGVARIIINTQAAAAKAGYLTPTGIATLAAGALGVVSAVIATKKGIDQIRSTQVPGGNGGGVGAVSSTPPPVYTGGSTPISAPQVGVGSASNPTTQIASTIAQASNKPVQAYVVSSQISSQQALDRRTNVASTFN